MHHKTLKGFIRGPYQKERSYSTMLNGTLLALEIFPARKPSLHSKLFVRALLLYIQLNPTSVKNLDRA